MKKMKIFAVLAALTVFSFAFTSCDLLLNALKNELSTEKKGDKDSEDTEDKDDKDTGAKISVTVAYKEFMDLDLEDREGCDYNCEQFEYLPDDEKAEYENDKEIYAWPHCGLVPNKWRYHAGKTYSLTIDEVKEKFPSNFYQYFTTYNGYPRNVWDDDKGIVVDLANNVKWDEKTAVESLTVLFDTIHGEFIRNLKSEDKELRYYFWNADAKKYTDVKLYWKGLAECGAGEFCAGWTYRHYDFFTDAARTKKVDWDNFDTLSKIYVAKHIYDSYNVKVNGDWNSRTEMTLEEIKTQYPESEGWKYYWCNIYSEKDDYQDWTGQQDIEIYDKDHDPYGY